jgi:hypothetical protein
MRPLAAALALVCLCACAGSYTNGGTDLIPPDGGGSPSVDGGSDGGDGGSDGGVDGGPDAGCVQRSLNVGAIDNCVGAANATASVFVSDPAQGCSVSITINTASTPCAGVASHGTLDAFDGGCAGTGYSCTSPSLPGTLTCTTSLGFCTIRICDAGVCGP